MDAGTFETGHELDVMATVPLGGAGSLVLDAKTLRARDATREVVLGWKEVLVATLDVRDPRVILMVVKHEGEDRLMRFRPALSTQPLYSNIEWMAGNMTVEYDDDLGDDPIENFVTTGLVVSTGPCTGPGCEDCDRLYAFQQAHMEQR